MKKIRFLLCVIIALFLSCSTLVKDRYLPALSDMEKPVYVMKNDVKIDDRILRKGQRVRLIISSDDEWIKVHGYAVETDALKAERVLLLFLFEDDFKDEEFDMKHFQDKLSEIVQEETIAPVMEVKTPDKKVTLPKTVDKNTAVPKTTDSKKPVK